MDKFPSGVDPRTLGIGHRERGPKRFEYTYDDLADAFGVSPRTLRNWVHSGKLDPGDLGAVLDFHCRRLGRGSRRHKRL